MTRLIERISRASCLYAVCVLTLSVLSFSAEAARKGQILLIIDDMGNKASDEVVFALPTQVALAILPHTHYAESFANRAAGESRDVILHLPMEALAGNALGPGGLTADMHPAVIVDTLEAAMRSVPNALGINNHMGSKLTQITLPMKTIMDVLAARDMFFIDSKTTRFSRATALADAASVPSLSRHIFLDHGRTATEIRAQFARMERIARRYGLAVGIAHPYPETVEVLLPILNALAPDLVLVNVSDVMAVRKTQLAKRRNQQPKTALNAASSALASPQ